MITWQPDTLLNVYTKSEIVFYITCKKNIFLLIFLIKFRKYEDRYDYFVS